MKTKTTVERMFAAARKGPKAWKELSTLVLKFEKEADLGSPAHEFWRLRRENWRLMRWLRRWQSRSDGKIGKSMGLSLAAVDLEELRAAIRGESPQKATPLPEEDRYCGICEHGRTYDDFTHRCLKYDVELKTTRNGDVRCRACFRDGKPKSRNL